MTSPAPSAWRCSAPVAFAEDRSAADHSFAWHGFDRTFNFTKRLAC